MHAVTQKFPSRQTLIRALIIGALGTALVACGGGGPSGSDLIAGSGDGPGTTTPAPESAAAKIRLTPTEATLTLGESVKVTAVVMDANNKPISGAVVNFATDETLGLLSPSAGLTNSNGEFVSTLSVASITASGKVGEITATAKFSDASGTTKTATNTMAYQVNSSTLKIDSMQAGVSNISANANTSVEVIVSANGNPISGEIVKFSSQCAQSGKATIDATAVTNSTGKAIASFTDKGCATTDTITATLSNSTRQQVSLGIAAPAATSLQFATIAPEDGVITLKGYGSATRPETAQVQFKLVDATGAPLAGQPVAFSLDVSVGGVALQNALNGIVTATTNSNGIATATVLAGNQPTPVRITAKSGALVSTSGKLAISSGFPDQDSISLSADRYNINGWRRDGATATITMRFADHFNNPVPDGTAINFITSGGRIGSGTQGSCSSKDSQCSITLNSQQPRPLTTANNTIGRVQVLAYAVGEESFVDKNNTIVADQVNELVDINDNPGGSANGGDMGVGSDVGEAYVDINESGHFELGVDQLVDYNSNNTYDGPDGKYNGSLCASSFANCSQQKTLNIFKQATFVFSSDIPTPPALKTLVGTCNTTERISAYIPDENLNILPAGTIVAFAVTDGDGEVTFGKSTTVPSATPLTGAKIAGATLFDFSFKYGSIADDGKRSCKSGTMTISVTTPDHGGGAQATKVYGLGYTVQ